MENKTDFENMSDGQKRQYERFARGYEKIVQMTGKLDTQCDADLEEEFRRFDLEAEALRKNRRDRTDAEYFTACREVPMELIREAAQAVEAPFEEVKEMVLIIIRRGMPVAELLDWLKEAIETGSFA